MQVRHGWVRRIARVPGNQRVLSALGAVSLALGFAACVSSSLVPIIRYSGTHLAPATAVTALRIFRTGVPEDPYTDLGTVDVFCPTEGQPGPIGIVAIEGGCTYEQALAMAIQKAADIGADGIHSVSKTAVSNGNLSSLLATAFHYTKAASLLDSRGWPARAEPTSASSSALAPPSRPKPSAPLAAQTTKARQPAAVPTLAVRSLKPLEPPTAAPARSRAGRNQAVLFATTRYDDKRWPQLETPTSDAREIADDLASLYGFEVEIVYDTSVEKMRAKIHQLAESSYAAEDQLFIMFAGHGDKDETLKKGWIIARDTRVDNHQSAYPYSELREDIDNIPCRHILLVLDVCFGGSFDPSIRDAQTRGREYQEATTEEFIRRKLRYRSRLYISSVDQRTEAPEGRGHSPFAWKLLEAFRQGGGSDGVLTWNELLGYLEKLSPEPRGGIFPRTTNSDPGGDFLFIRKTQAPR